MEHQLHEKQTVPPRHRNAKKGVSFEPNTHVSIYVKSCKKMEKS